MTRPSPFSVRGRRVCRCRAVSGLAREDEAERRAQHGAAQQADGNRDEKPVPERLLLDRLHGAALVRLLVGRVDRDLNGEQPDGGVLGIVAPLHLRNAHAPVNIARDRSGRELKASDADAIDVARRCGVAPRLGRNFSEDDAKPGAAP